MNTIELITKICNEFIEKKYDIIEFQSRLQIILIDDEFKKELSEILYNVDNKLEEIRFSSLSTNFYKYGIKVAEDLLERISIMKKINSK